jgi:hypothetical protein
MAALATSGESQESAAILQSYLQGAAETERRLNAVAAEAEKYPKQALSDAETLPLTEAFSPDSCARLTAFEFVARAASKGDQLVAKAALHEAEKLAEQLPPMQSRRLKDAIPIYLSIGDSEGARRALNILLEIAKKLYSIDSDPQDPNQVFKGMWPSTDLWRYCVQFAVKLSPTLPQEIIVDISDLEIAALERIVYATSLLGGDIGSWEVAEKNQKTGNHLVPIKD